MPFKDRSIINDNLNGLGDIGVDCILYPILSRSDGRHFSSASMGEN